MRIKSLKNYYFQNIFQKISGSQEDNQISIFGCPHSFFGHRGHEDTQILLPCGVFIIIVMCVLGFLATFLISP